MISAGNDIVCLNAVDIPRTKQPKFYSRILSVPEQALYSNHQYADIPFEHFVWLLWSIKESAFKYLQRANPTLIFSPTKFIVTELNTPGGFKINSLSETESAQYGFGDNALKGIVAYADFKLYSRSVIYQEAIISVVDDDDSFKNICWGIKSINNTDPDSQSTESRSLLKDVLKDNYNVADASIGKTADGIPFLSLNKDKVTHPISLSHHGNFVGYSFRLNKYLLSATQNQPETKQS